MSEKDSSHFRLHFGNPKIQRRICKICLTEIKNLSLFNLFFSSIDICPSCLKKLKPIIFYYKINQTKIISLYKYEEPISSWLYQFKGLYDYELHDIFLNYWAYLFHVRFIKYVVVPMPSNKSDDDDRGFNHVTSIFKGLKLPIIPCLYKEEPFKQALANKKEREENVKKIKINKNAIKQYDHILLVDDVVTTGYSLSRAIKLIKDANPNTKVFCLTVFRDVVE